MVVLFQVTSSYIKFLPLAFVRVVERAVSAENVKNGPSNGEFQPRVIALHINKAVLY